MFYYNQNNYSGVDYSYNGNAKTVASSGCGVCSACMVLNNLYGKEMISVPAMASYSKSVGARDNTGTNMNTLLKALSKKYSISYRTTSKNAELLAHLKSGGMAIINQGEAYNVFSTAGHFVVAYKIASGETIRCLDPQLYANKYNSYDRPNRIVKTTGNEVWVTLSQIGKATIDRNPSYYLVSFIGKKNKPTIKAGQTITLKSGAYLYKEHKAGKKLKISDISQFNVSTSALLKKGAKVVVGKMAVNTHGNIWAFVDKYGAWICVYNYGADVSKI